MTLDPNLAFITADVNGDHHPDIVTVQGAVFLGEGDGVDYTLVPNPGLPQANNGPTTFGPTIISADFNNDGKLDIATNDGMTIRTFIGKGNGTFTAGNAYATIEDSAFMEATDLDGDGNVDIWTGYSGAGVFGPSAVEAANPLLGNGDGTFQGAQSLPTAFAGGNLIDLNKDGIPDIAGPVGTGSSGFVFTTFLGQPNGTFKAGPQLNFPNFVTDSFVLGDFNGDGIPDLIFLGSGVPINGYFVAIGDGNGGFGTPTLIPAPVLLPPPDIDINLNFSGLTAADFNHDGKLDIAYSFMDASFATQNITQGFVVQLGNGDGSFKPPVITLTYSSLSAPLFAFNNFIGAVADVNGDNFPDMFLILPTVITDGTAQHQVELFVANGDGSFKAPTNLTLAGNMLAPTNFSFSGSPIAVGDLNGDGKVDLVASGSSADGTIPEIAIALGNGNGTFQASTVQPFPGFGPMTEPVLADFDGDGKLDLFVAGSGSIAGIFPGIGNGTFQMFPHGSGQVLAPQAFLLNVWGPATTADIDGDGKPDLMVGNVVLINKNGQVPPVTAATTTTLGASPNPATLGQTVTLTATVTSTAAGAITGTVTFFDGANSIGTGSVGAGGVATLETSALSVATHSITAKYGGDTNFSTSTSTAVSLVINSAAGKAATSTALGASPNPAAAGATVTFTATVTSTTAGAITGTVTFLDNGVSIGTGSVGAGGVATLQTSTLAAGTHPVTASYGGDTNFAMSSSTSVSLVINAAPVKAATATALTALPNPAGAGASVTLTATVTSATAGAITGTVTFLDGANSIGAGGVGAGGIATFSTSVLATATHSITASYGGDANFATSTSPAVSLVITAAPTFALSVAPTGLTVSRNEPGLAVVTVTPMNGFNQQVNLSCSSTDGIECEFEPGSLTPDGAPVRSNLKVSVEGEDDARPAKPAGVAIGPVRRGDGFGASGGGAGTFAIAAKRLFVPLLGCEMILLAGLWRRRKFVARYPHLQAACALVLLLSVATIVAGCSGSPRRQGATTITISATAEDGPAVSVPFSVTVR